MRFQHGLHQDIFFSIISNTVVAGQQVMGAFRTSLMVGGFWSQALLQDKYCQLSDYLQQNVLLYQKFDQHSSIQIAQVR